MTEPTAYREYLQLALYPTSGRIVTIKDGEASPKQQRTCLFLNLVQSTIDDQTTISVQLNVDASVKNGGYIDIVEDIPLNRLKAYPGSIRGSHGYGKPTRIRGRGQVISSKRLTKNDPEIYPTPDDRQELELQLAPVNTQDSTGMLMQFGTKDTEGAALTLTPYQTNHFAKMVKSVLNGGRSFSAPESPKRGIVKPEGGLNIMENDPFTRRNPSTD